jgi:hypothetical protein
MLALALALVSLTGAQARPVTPFDPAGKWTYSTLDDQGAPISGTMEITGTPGAYTGTIVSDRTLQINDVLTSANAAVVLTNLPNGGVAVIKIWRDADGTLQCGWGPIPTVIPVKIARAK